MQQYGFQKQWTSLNGSISFTLTFSSTSKANFPSQIAAFVAVSKTQKRGELMRYLGPLRILQNAQNHTYQNSFQARNLTNYVN